MREFSAPPQHVPAGFSHMWKLTKKQKGKCKQAGNGVVNKVCKQAIFFSLGGYVGVAIRNWGWFPCLLCTVRRGSRIIIMFASFSLLWERERVTPLEKSMLLSKKLPGSIQKWKMKYFVLVVGPTTEQIFFLCLVVSTPGVRWRRRKKSVFSSSFVSYPRGASTTAERKKSLPISCALPIFSPSLPPPAATATRNGKKLPFSRKKSGGEEIQPPTVYKVSLSCRARYHHHYVFIQKYFFFGKTKVKSGKFRHTESDSHLAPITASSRKKIDKKSTARTKWIFFLFLFRWKRPYYMWESIAYRRLLSGKACVFVPPSQLLQSRLFSRYILYTHLEGPNYAHPRFLPL